VTPLIHEDLDRRSGVDRRRSSGDRNRRYMDSSPITDWPLVVPDLLREVKVSDPWARVVHLAIVDTLAGRHADASAAWEEDAAWLVAGVDPTTEGTGQRPDAGIERGRIRSFHQGLNGLSGGTFRQELVSIEGGRGPLVEAHVRTTAERDDRRLDIPSLIVFELPALRIRRVTEFPGDLPAWDAFWRS
jgi:hypothetical protein